MLEEFHTLFNAQNKQCCGESISIDAALRHDRYRNQVIVHGKTRLCAHNVMIPLAVFNEVALIHAGGHHRHLPSRDNAKILAPFGFRILNTDAPGALILFAAEHKDVSAKIDDRRLYLVIQKNFFDFIRSIALCNGAQVQRHAWLF